jgi:hypothetical protein
MRVGPPGAPSLIDVVELVATVAPEPGARFRIVSCPVNNPLDDPVPAQTGVPLEIEVDARHWPVTYIVVESISALVAPPGTAIVHALRFAAEPQAVCRAVFVGSCPEPWFGRTIMPPVGITETAEADPPHSGPQLKT